MNDVVKADDSNNYNDRSLKTLIRALTLSQGQFSLILVRCNYKRLQQEMVERLRSLCSLDIQEITLSASVQTLYTTLQVKTRSLTSGGNKTIAALSIFGLEEAIAIDEILTSTNQVRDEFRKNFTFPVVLWIADEVAAKLIRLAPDFKSWAAATIKFERSTSELTAFLRQEADSIFTQAAKNIARSQCPGCQSVPLWNFGDRENERNTANSTSTEETEVDLGIGSTGRRELESAWKDLRDRGQILEPCLAASLQFVFGRDSYARDQISDALEHYQQSLDLWQQVLRARGISEIETSKPNSSLLWGLGGSDRRPRHTPEFREQTRLAWDRSTEELWSPWAQKFDLEAIASAINATVNLKKSSPKESQTSCQNPHQETRTEQAKESLEAESKTPSELNLGDQIQTRQILERQGMVLFHIALCHRLQAARNPVSSPYWQQAKSCLERSQTLFEHAGRPDLVAGAITHRGEVLQRLEAWGELQTLAENSLELHFAFGTPCQLAQDYGFLAEVALHHSKWTEAFQLASLALEILKQDQANPAEKSLYLLLLAQSLRQVGELTAALDHLKLAQAQSNPKYDPRLYIDILAELRSLYFEQGEYFKAFRIKKKQREIEHQYRFRAFIGALGLKPQQQALNPDVPPDRTAKEAIAEEMVVSCRQEDIKRLLERISRDDHKLTIVHGRSGVGKSSLVNAGLVPALKNFTVSARQAMPVVVRIYADWPGELEKALLKALSYEQQDLSSDGNSDSILTSCNSIQDSCSAARCKSALILDLLRLATERNLLTVIIFDQFEEFFFAANTWAERKPFYDFLRACLNLPFVKILLSLREDYLHYLLEFDFLAQNNSVTTQRQPNLDAVNNILDKQIRYQLRDFSARDAREVIQCLTERAQFYLEPPLIDAIVADLAGELQEVRPIELQVVGAQLQEEGITTLRQYQQLGANPKAELVKRSLERVISDCGPENEDAAWKILFSLTDERGMRLIKTKYELSSVNSQTSTLNPQPSTINTLRIKAKKTNNGQQATESLNLILEILVGHGLVFLLRETPEDRYQLVHDYLVGPIRQRFGLEARLHQAEADKKISQEQLYRTNKILKQLLALSVIGVVLLMGSTIAAVDFWRRTVAQKQQVVAQRQRADIHTLTAASEALFLSNQQFDALMESLRAGRHWRQLQESGTTNDETEVLIAAALQQAVYGVKERNRLEGHGDVVWGVSFSPDGSAIASASVDKTVKLWRRDGSLLGTLQGHSQSVSSVSWSPDSQILATASVDKTVKLWRRDGKLLTTLTGHTDAVNSVSFSSNGLLLASSSRDKTVKLWSRSGELIRTLVHQVPVNWVSFSPDGSMVATATDMGTVQVWTTDGYLVATFQHSDRSDPTKIYSVSFSPDGQLLATGGADNQIKLWSLADIKSRKATKKLSFRSNQQFNFQPVGMTGDLNSWESEKVMLLGQATPDSQGGRLLQTLKGHNKWILNLSFSPNGKTLASTSADNTVKLWDISPMYDRGDRFLPQQVRGAAVLLETLVGHGDQVTQASWSPDSKTLASSSYDKTVRIWSLNPVRIKVLEGHQEKVLGVNFSPNGLMLASAAADKTVKLWSRNGVLLSTLVGHSQRVTSVSFSRDGKWLASGSYDKTVKLWSLKSPGSLPDTALPFVTLKGHADGVVSVSFSPNSRLIASASKDKTVKIWSSEGKLIETLKGHSGWVNSVSFSPDGNLLASASDDGTVKIWNLAPVYGQIEGQPKGVRNTDLLLKTIEAHKNFVLGVSFSPDGRLIASASYDNTLKLWSLTPLKEPFDLKSRLDLNWMLDRKPDLKSAAKFGGTAVKKDGSLLATLLKGASDSVTGVSFSPDGQLIASASYDNTVKLWNRQGVLLRTLRGHHNSVMGVSFSPDGKILASASRDKTVILWNLDLDDLLGRGCHWVSDYLKTNPNVSDRDRHLCDGVVLAGDS